MSAAQGGHIVAKKLCHEILIDQGLLGLLELLVSKLLVQEQVVIEQALLGHEKKHLLIELLLRGSCRHLSDKLVLNKVILELVGTCSLIHQT